MSLAKKRKAVDHKKSNGNQSKSSKVLDFDQDAFHVEIGYSELSMEDIHARIQDLCRGVPKIPDSKFAEKEGGKGSDSSGSRETLPQPIQEFHFNKTEIREWATSLQTVLEEFHLLVACVSPATYAWGTDRSGAADQNLSLLSNEFMRAQEQLIARVSPRLNDVLAPVVTLVTDKTVTEKVDGKEVKQNYFITTHEDPDYANLCYTILARNAASLRQVVIANFDKLLRAVHDFLNAQHKDNQHDSRGFVY
jgi:hypothetical protein